jgi:hypothetical protein
MTQEQSKQRQQKPIKQKEEQQGWITYDEFLVCILISGMAVTACSSADSDLFCFK